MRYTYAGHIFRKIAAPGLTVSETLEALSEVVRFRPEDVEQWKVDAALHAVGVLRSAWEGWEE